MKMERIGHRVGLLLVALALLNASSLVTPAFGADADPQPGDWFQQQAIKDVAENRAFAAFAPICEVPEPVDTSGWKHMGRIKAPPRFKPDPSIECIEGCSRWTDGERAVLLVSGHWGPTSFGSANRCRTMVGQRQALVMSSKDQSGRRNLTLWLYEQAGPGHTTIYTVEFVKESDSALAWTLLRTVAAGE